MTPFFNAQHSPMGAFFSFTCGNPGTRGGLGLQLGKPAGQDLFIGVKEGGRRGAGAIRCLPFFEGAKIREGAQAAFTPEAAATAPAGEMTCFGEQEIVRRYGWATDAWETPSFTFVIYTPFGAIPEPDGGAAGEMRAALLPAVVAELRVDNRRGSAAKTAFFAVNFQEAGVRLMDVGLPAGRVGFGVRSHLGVVAEVVGGEGEPFVFNRWDVAEGLMAAEAHLLGITPGVGVEVPAGKMVTLRLAMGCYLGGVVTTRLEGRYLYTRYFSGIEDVLNAGLDGFEGIRERCERLDVALEGNGARLNADQRFLVAHATRSYYGSTQLLEVAGLPYWVVNEGEYCMMNTLDLSIDHMFWELEKNPWVVKNLLDNFVRYYCYQDEVKGSGEASRFGGGISFCHDQGVHNQFSPLGQSAYELPNLGGCFSYMTQEELCNWILLAASYVAKTGDEAWAGQNAHVISACGESMLARDHWDAGRRTGVTQLDSTRCGMGQEITSYDSLDASLAQTRNNCYIAVKCWAAYLGLGRLFEAMGRGAEGARWLETADRTGRTVVGQVQADGTLPALFEMESPHHASRILPAIEGLVYLLYWERGSEHLRMEGRYGALLRALRTHTATLLGDAAGRNKFKDGGIRLSSTSNNSWASKIAIVEHVARTLFDLDEDGNERRGRNDAAGWERSDAAHRAWQTHPVSAYWACSDQIVNGVARGSKYYPRIITAALWLESHSL